MSQLLSMFLARFYVIKNEAEYEALALGLLTAKHLWISWSHAFSDSQLVVGQVNDSYKAQDPKMIQFLEVIQNLMHQFYEIKLSQIPREDHTHADALVRLANAAKVHSSRSVPVELVDMPSIIKMAMAIPSINKIVEWISPVIDYLKDGSLPTRGQKCTNLK